MSSTSHTTLVDASTKIKHDGDDSVTAPKRGKGGKAPQPRNGIAL